MTPVKQQSTTFVKGLGLTDATTLVMGSMIGSGIFIVSADVSRQVQSPALLIICWLLGALLTIVAALSYGELAAAIPQAGGQYVTCVRPSGACGASSTAGLCSSYPNRDDCGRGGGIREVHGRLLSF